MIPKRLSNKEVEKPRLKFKPGLALIGFRKTGPRVIAPLFFVLLSNLRFELQSDVILTGSL